MNASPQRLGLCSFVRTHSAATVITFRGALLPDRDAATARALDDALRQLDSAAGYQQTGVVIADLTEAELPSAACRTAFLTLLGRRVTRNGRPFAAVATRADLSRALGD